jgi:hypothetical protein
VEKERESTSFTAEKLFLLPPRRRDLSPDVTSRDDVTSVTTKSTVTSNRVLLLRLPRILQ